MKRNLRYCFGIDFGTTNSATVSYVVSDDSGSSELFQYGDKEGRPIPSAVAINRKDGRVYTGRDAWDRKMELSESCEYISSIKTHLDEDWQNDSSKKISGHWWNPTDVACEVLKGLKNSVKERTGILMQDATVAIPVGFSPSKRAVLRKAAQQTGIQINAFVSEPTAAFFANYDALKSCTLIAVFDWGGGTLDVSILQHRDGKISELAAVGAEIAGDAIDRKIADRIHARIARKTGRAIAFEDMPSGAKDMMLVRCERAKRMLADDDTAIITINRYGEYGTCYETLDYDWFADIVDSDVRMAMDCLERAIHESGKGSANIDRILMVGGSSNLRPLVEKMDEKYGDKLYFPDETMWNVGQGAAMLARNPGMYCASQNISLVLSDGSDFPLLKAGEPVKNWRQKWEFGIVDTSQEARFVFGGSPDISALPDRRRTLSVPNYRFLQERIILKAAVTQDMIFTVEAGSNMRSKDFHRIWEYPFLKCDYQLPER